MGARYLIDSNTLIEFTGRLLPDYAYNRLASIIDTDFNISFINKIEVLAHSAADPAWINFINRAAVIKIDDDIVDELFKSEKNTR